MRAQYRRISAVVALLGGCGFLLTGPATTCSSFTGRTALVAADFCFIFDCQNGILGGTIDPCTGMNSGDQTVEGETALPLFTDCPTVF